MLISVRTEVKKRDGVLNVQWRYYVVGQEDGRYCERVCQSQRGHRPSPSRSTYYSTLHRLTDTMTPSGRPALGAVCWDLAQYVFLHPNVIPEWRRERNEISERITTEGVRVKLKTWEDKRISWIDIILLLHNVFLCQTNEESANRIRTW